ncbi:mannitol dehydrogenase family protein [Niveispirillum sp. KHB5.9]|uniref:mannitol dehydrogenase family protein n=1 Tax=Niveispirillum sp. KHB5.9 TaxID=3400269 RepID=UPI003A86C083
MDLSRATLSTLPTAIARPGYDPAMVRAGIVHLGFGGFHRAHMARYTHDLMERRGDAAGWGIIGIGLRAGDVGVHDALAPQDALYTLVERQDGDETAVVIGSVCRVIQAAASAKAVLDAIDDPAIRIVSLTVTQNGYCLNAATKLLDLDHPAILHDLAHPAQPLSAVGIIVEACRRRMAAGLPAFTAMSCDNIQHNGRVLRGAVLALAGRRDAALTDWIAANASFPGTMVDRITPVTTPAMAADFAARSGLADRWPVFCEHFRQWVIEDDFTAGRPAWEEAGAQFVADVAPYEFMKLRLLNTSHLAVAGLGRLLGHIHIDETMRDPALRCYMRALMDRETGPTLPPVPGIDLDAYKDQLIRRFGNVAIKDTVDRVNADAPINLLVEPIGDRLAAGAGVDLLALALAAWMRRLTGVDEAGRPIEVVHPLAGLLRERACAGGGDPVPLLGIRPLFGDLVGHEAFVATLRTWLTSLHVHGARTTLSHARARLGF